MPNSSLVGTAGVYFVAAKLNALGLHCAPTSGSAPSVDLMVSNEDGSRTIALQVKTTRRALRYRGRGEDKVPYECQWEIGEKCARLDSPGLWFALVDLKAEDENSSDFTELPDVYLVPSRVICRHFAEIVRQYDAAGKKLIRWRYHKDVESLKRYRNAWQSLLTQLGVSSD